MCPLYNVLSKVSIPSFHPLGDDAVCPVHIAVCPYRLCYANVPLVSYSGNLLRYITLVLYTLSSYYAYYFVLTHDVMR